ncbi:MAG: hypothetical protein ABJN51_21710, partial [Sneathiella sp.]
MNGTTQYAIIECILCWLSRKVFNIFNQAAQTFRNCTREVIKKLRLLAAQIPKRRPKTILAQTEEKLSKLYPDAAKGVNTNADLELIRQDIIAWERGQQLVYRKHGFVEGYPHPGAITREYERLIEAVRNAKVRLDDICN